MKKLTLHKVYTLSVLLIIATGCGNYLSENPDNRVELNTVDKAAQLLTNAYSGGSYAFTDWMGDMVDFIPATTKLQNNDQAYHWEDFTGDAQDTPANLWQNNYDAIAHSNAVLAVIDNLPGDDDAKRAAVKAEALLTRAYGHFILVNIFARQYDKTKASTDLGIPYVLEPETEFIKKYKRNTVKEVYDLMEADILAGLKLVNDGFYANSGKYHFTKNAALAFASRFYFFKADYSNCLKYSTQLLGSNPDVFIKDLPTIQATRIDSDDFIRKYHAPGDPSNILLIRWVTNCHIPRYGYWPSSAHYSQIFNSGPFNGDLRADPAFVAGASDNSGGVAAARFEFLFERSSITSNVGLNYTIFIGFRGEEVVLNRAESNTNLGNYNDAITDLQYFASKRYTGNPQVTLTALKNAYGTSNSQAALMSYILDERSKEFIEEGMRWFDIKRFDLPVTHKLSDGTEITLTAKDKRKIIQIPQSAIDIGGLEPNPR